MIERAALFGGTLEAGARARVPCRGTAAVRAAGAGRAGRGRDRMTTEPIRVLLVDDQQLVRVGFRMILADEPGIEVVGEAPDGRAALDACRGPASPMSW